MRVDHERRPPTGRGVVLRFDPDKGYGQIRRAGGRGTIIVHESAVERSGLIGLFPGQEVEFDLVPWGGYQGRQPPPYRCLRRVTRPENKTMPAPRNPIVRWIDYRLPIFTYVNRELVDCPTPRNLSYWWNFGSLAGIMLVIMIVSGVFLAMFYTPEKNLAFDSVERIMRDVNYGWLVRYIHMVGASMFFALVYIHIFRGLY